MRLAATTLLVLIVIAAPARAQFILGRFWSVPNDPPSDLAFAYAVEDSVRAGLAERDGGLRLEAVLGPQEARLVRGLGCGHHGCRETAGAALGALGARADRAIIWGTFVRDDEVAERCWVLLEARGLAVACWHCGWCRTWEPVPEDTRVRLCRVCWGEPVRGGRKAPR